MLPGDEMVADYLARVGRAAASVLPPTESAVVVEDISRRVRMKVGPSPRWDTEGTRRRLHELGEPERLVSASAHRPGVLPPTATFPAAAREDEFNDTLDLGPVPGPRHNPHQPRVEVRIADPEGGPRRRWGLLRTLTDRHERTEDAPPRVRPSRADELLRPDPFAGWGRLGFEILAMLALGLGVFLFGILAYAVGALLVVRSRFWEITDKVRVLLLIPVIGVVVAVLWAWISATQVQESDDSGARVSAAGDSLADSFAAMPELFGVLGALYLGYALVRDNHAL